MISIVQGPQRSQYHKGKDRTQCCRFMLYRCLIFMIYMSLQTQWVPISLPSSAGTTVIIPTSNVTPNMTPDDKQLLSPQMRQQSTPSQQLLSGTLTQFRFQNFFTTPIPQRQSPLPHFHWADSQEVWQVMLKKEEHYIRNPNMLSRHPQLQPRMRSILLDWLIEVSFFI